MLKEFKDFISRGNVLDLAIAVIIGGAFGAVVLSFVDDVLMPLIAAVVGQPDFNSLTIDVGDSAILYGSFLTILVNFLFIAGAVFLIVKAVNSAKGPQEEEEAAATEAELLAEIRDELRAQRS